MSDENKRSKRPDWRVVNKQPYGKDVEVGVGWSNDDGSVWVKFNAIPINGAFLLKPLDNANDAPKSADNKE